MDRASRQDSSAPRSARFSFSGSTASPHGAAASPDRDRAALMSRRRAVFAAALFLFFSLTRGHLVVISPQEGRKEARPQLFLLRTPSEWRTSDGKAACAPPGLARRANDGSAPRAETRGSDKEEVAL